MSGLGYTAARRARLGVLISGRGSNMTALLDACARSDYPASPALVLSNIAEAGGPENGGGARGGDGGGSTSRFWQGSGSL